MIGHVQLKWKNSLTVKYGTLESAETHCDGGIFHQVFAEIDHIFVWKNSIVAGRYALTFLFSMMWQS